MDKELERSEWDFSRCKTLTDPELNACLSWEYLREIVRFDPDIAKRIVHPFLPIEMHSPGAKPRQHIEWSDDPETESRRADFETQQQLSRYFPETPYLKLPQEYRARLLKLSPSFLGFTIREHILEIKPGDLMPHKWTDTIMDRLEVVSLGIDWTMAPDALIASFRQIIEARRGERKAKPKRGTAPGKLMRDRLKRLGALRTWKHWAANYGEIQHSHARDLYQSRQAWIKQTGLAADDVRRFREELENRF
jgi:hypothetical protein